MKKSVLFSLLLSMPFLASCITSQHIQPQQIYGIWGCATKYEDIGTGVKDIVDIKPDGHFRMSGFIFDHTLHKLAKKNIDNYFFSLLSYRTNSAGTWQLKGNALTYEITNDKVTRAISPKVMAEIQKSPGLRELEQKLFDVYSKKERPKEKDKIELIITRLDENGFTAKQIVGKSQHLSVCKRLTDRERENVFEFFFPLNKT
ncbi:hypothetical protein HPC38_10250 [Pasteurellaceae bacterium HPA106]|uniref:hypothetical protein n=1 Tax=Spirabiliibacterium pneumoniae TaxID=221400 RepID=UPI001AACF4E1|nr:hypothetical protein [Spirabiliibacterium pneumoniae]MBE2897247.1 hypothetical protein [Spirabiliibacterium pneumoniae]